MVSVSPHFRYDPARTTDVVSIRPRRLSPDLPSGRGWLLPVLGPRPCWRVLSGSVRNLSKRHYSLPRSFQLPHFATCLFSLLQFLCTLGSPWFSSNPIYACFLRTAQRLQKCFPERGLPSHGLLVAYLRSFSSSLCIFARHPLWLHPRAAQPCSPGRHSIRKCLLLTHMKGDKNSLRSNDS